MHIPRQACAIIILYSSEKKNNFFWTCAPSEESDKPAHLLRVFSTLFSYKEADVQADLSLH